MGLVKDVDHNIDREIAVGNQTLRLKGALTVPPGFNPLPFLSNVEAAIDALKSEDPQTRIPFGKVLSTDKFTVTADKPVKARKTYEFTVKLDVSGEGGYEQASSIFALSQVLGSKPHMIEILEKPVAKKAAPATSEIKQTPEGAKVSQLPQLSEMLPEKWTRMLDKAGLKTVDAILSYRNNAEKLSDDVKGLAVDDAKTLLETVQAGILKHFNEHGLSVEAVPGVAKHWADEMAKVNLKTAEAVASIGPEGLMKLKIPQLTHTQAQSIVSFCDKAVEMAAAVKEELPANAN